ncbi:putative RNA-directed DNA polymerase from transposon BS [Trichonephila clavipes]|nr:putative RNA-directed DNA polymerase from transposon BS [Trichonephila clavipes]
MPQISPFAAQKAIQGIGGEPKSVKKLRSGDLRIETTFALQTKSFLFSKTFLDSPLTVSHQTSLNTSRGAISEPDMWCTSETEILNGFSDQGVIEVRRITIKKDNSVIPTKHLTLTFNSPSLPKTIKAGYLNCTVRPYIPNPLRCFKYCSLEQKCVNCSQPHSSDSKLCPNWILEKEIQTIKTNKNITYADARKSIAPQLSQTYAQTAKSLLVSDSTQTDENVTKLVCPRLKILRPASPLLKKYLSLSIPTVSTSSTTEAHLLPSTSTISEPQTPIPKFNTNDPSYLADQIIVKKIKKTIST